MVHRRHYFISLLTFLSNILILFYLEGFEGIYSGRRRFFWSSKDESLPRGMTKFCLYLNVFWWKESLFKVLPFQVHFLKLSFLTFSCFFHDFLTNFVSTKALEIHIFMYMLLLFTRFLSKLIFLSFLALILFPLVQLSI